MKKTDLTKTPYPAVVFNKVDGWGVQIDDDRTILCDDKEDADSFYESIKGIGFILSVEEEDDVSVGNDGVMRINKKDE